MFPFFFAQIDAAVWLAVYGVDRNGSLAGYNVQEFTCPMTAMCNERGMIARER